MPKLAKEKVLVLPDYEDIVRNVEAIETISEIPRLMKAWGSIKREALRRKKLFEEMETVRKRIEKQMKYSMVIPDDGSGASEKIDMTGIGSVQKVTKSSLKVFDWTALMKWAVNKHWTEIIQKRQGQTAVTALEQALIDDVDLTLPSEIAEFQTYPQLVINKSTKLQ